MLQKTTIWTSFCRLEGIEVTVNHIIELSDKMCILLWSNTRYSAW